MQLSRTAEAEWSLLLLTLLYHTHALSANTRGRLKIPPAGIILS